MPRNQEDSPSNRFNPGDVGADRRARNRHHWDSTLDARNLSAHREGPPLERQLALAESLDVRIALRHLATLGDRLVLDLGGGLGLHAILLARAGARVIVCDISPYRLRAARDLAREAGVPEGRIAFVAAEAEHLPIAGATLDGIFTKSVLIHTDLPRAADECARVLSPAGRAVFIEPLDRNPFVTIYRWLLAPREWRDITRYFDKDAMDELTLPFRARGFKRSVTPVHYVGFFASFAQFSLESPRLMRVMESLLSRFDHMVFAVFPAFRRYAWFAVTRISPSNRRNRS